MSNNWRVGPDNSAMDVLVAMCGELTGEINKRELAAVKAQVYVIVGIAIRRIVDDCANFADERGAASVARDIRERWGLVIAEGQGG